MKWWWWGEGEEEDGAFAGDDYKHFCAFAIWLKCVFTRFQMRNPAAPRHFSYSLVPTAACLEKPPLVAYFWNSYLDEWLKLSHSQQVSPLLFKEEWESCHLLMHCLPSCMQMAQASPSPSALPFPPVGPQRVAVGDWSGSMASLEMCGMSAHPPCQPGRRNRSCILIWCDQWDRRNKEGVLHTVDLWPLKSGRREQNLLTPDR